MLAGPVPERANVQLFVDGSGSVVHGLVATMDSVSFVPKHEAPACATCRSIVARTQVDSVRVRRFSWTRTTLLGAAILGVIVIPAWPEESS